VMESEPKQPGPPYHDDALLTLAQAAEVLNVSYSTITKWTARGEFCPAAFKLPNGRYRVRYRDLIRWALSLRGQ
jgi:excisionase family DNA binding protein